MLFLCSPRVWVSLPHIIRQVAEGQQGLAWTCLLSSFTWTGTELSGSGKTTVHTLISWEKSREPWKIKGPQIQIASERTPFLSSWGWTVPDTGIPGLSLFSTEWPVSRKTPGSRLARTVGPPTWTLVILALQTFAQDFWGQLAGNRTSCGTCCVYTEVSQAQVPLTAPCLLALGTSSRFSSSEVWVRSHQLEWLRGPPRDQKIMLMEWHEVSKETDWMRSCWKARSWLGTSNVTGCSGRQEACMCVMKTGTDDLPHMAKSLSDSCMLRQWSMSQDCQIRLTSRHSALLK